jgi:hypothetical protein
MGASPLLQWTGSASLKNGVALQLDRTSEFSGQLKKRKFKIGTTPIEDASMGVVPIVDDPNMEFASAYQVWC